MCQTVASTLELVVFLYGRDFFDFVGSRLFQDSTTQTKTDLLWLKVRFEFGQTRSQGAPTIFISFIKRVARCYSVAIAVAVAVADTVRMGG